MHTVEVLSVTFQKRCGLDCGSLNVIGPHEFIGSGFAMRCGFIEVCVALLEEVCPCGDGLCRLLCSSFSRCANQIISCCLRDKDVAPPPLSVSCLLEHSRVLAW